MRHLSFALCASMAVCGHATLATATTNPPLAFTLDLPGPCSPSGCGSSVHPTDIGLQVSANSFTYAQDTSIASSPFVATMVVSAPVVCDEVASSGLLGATSSFRVAPTFSNSFPGGLLEFNAGGTSIVDLNAITYDGATPPGVAASYSNDSAKPQVVCYQINPVGVGPAAYAAGPYGIFKASFEDHPSGEPWLSVQTVSSPTTSAAQPQGASTSTSTNEMDYVVQLHNAATAVGWHLSLGYDYALFDPVNNGNLTSTWCVLTSAQPGVLSTCGTAHGLAAEYIVASGDIQSATSSAYIQVRHYASAAASSNWNSLTSAIYPTVASVFPPFGTYPQRFDDKVAVASANNLPTLNIGSIVCNNDSVSTACVIRDQEGNSIPAALTFANTISGGTVNIDPLAYFVDPFGGTTLPGNVAADALTVSNVSCVDSSGILASPIGIGNFTTSPIAQGSSKLGFGFKPNGSLYVAGTATCTATFTTSGNASLPLSTTGSFTITMQQPTVAHFAVIAPTSATAGSASSITVTAQDSANHTVAGYSGTVRFTSSDAAATLPANATLTNGVGTFSGTLKTVGSRTVSATDTVASTITGNSGTISVNAGSATHFAVSAPASAMRATPFSISVTALDQFGNTAAAYAGTVHFTSATDAAAVLPANRTLTFGVGTPSVMFVTSGGQTVTATDTATSSLTGTSGAIAVN